MFTRKGRAESTTSYEWGALGHAVPAAPGSNLSRVDGTANNAAMSAARPETYYIATFDCWIDRLYVRSSGVMGGGIGANFTLGLNEVAQALTCNIAGAAQTEGTDLVNRISVNEGQRVYLHCDRSAGAPPALSFGASVRVTRR